MSNERWREDAACKGTHGYLFYPARPLERETRPEKRQRELQAKRVCARCSVRAECLAWAISHEEMSGVWGGTTELERRTLLRQAQPQSASRNAS
ncbi:MAG: WhiB family transcriptional regulator [Acidimicrobiales bacterium]